MKKPVEHARQKALFDSGLYVGPTEVTLRDYDGTELSLYPAQLPVRLAAHVPQMPDLSRDAFLTINGAKVSNGAVQYEVRDSRKNKYLFLHTDLMKDMRRIAVQGTPG